MRRRGWVLLGVGLMLVAAGVTWERRRSRAPGPTASPSLAAAIPVQADAAISGAVIEHAYAYGNLRPRLSVAITAQQPGQVSRILFADGARVEAGASLVEMDSRTAQANVESARARSLADQQALRRVVSLARQGLESTSSLEQAQSQAAVSQSGLRIAEAQLGMTTLRAPFAGILGPRLVDAGALVSSTDHLVVIEDRSQLNIEFRLPSRNLPRLREGMLFDVSVPNLNLDLGQGRLTFVDSAISTDTRSLLLRGVIQNEEWRLTPGLFVRLAIELEERPDAVLVPQASVLRDLLGAYVFVVDGTVGGNPVARRQAVQIGLRRGALTEVLTGVKSGEVVVTQGAFRLRGGDRVAVQAEPPVTAAVPVAGGTAP